MATIWKLQTADKNTLTTVRESGRIGLPWQSGDVQSLSSPKAIATQTQQQNPTLQNTDAIGVQLWDFCHVMAPDDLIILEDKTGNSTVVEVLGDYEYQENTTSGLCHQRTVKTTHLGAEGVWQMGGASPALGYDSAWTLVRCPSPIAPSDLGS